MDDEIAKRLDELNAAPESWKRGLARECSPVLENALNRRQMLVLQGLRRTGKTTLAKQIAFKWLKLGASYFSWDAVNPPYTPERLDSLLEQMQEKLVVVDEVQYVPNWQVVAKRHYERDDGRRFLLTGSASLELDKRSHETLAGRIQTHTLKTLSLAEYCKFAGKKPSSCVEEYLWKGGFPELVNESEAGFKSEYVQDTILRQFASRDLPTVFPDKNPEFALRILKLLAGGAGSVFQINSLSQALNSNRVTIASYYHALESGLIIRTAYNHTPSLSKQERTAKKCFFEDNGILSTLNPQVNEGALAENALARHLGQLWFERNSREIDFILPEQKLAVELKYQNSIAAEDEKPLREFLAKNREYRGVLVTKNDGKKGEISRVPLHEFLANPTFLS